MILEYFCASNIVVFRQFQVIDIAIFMFSGGKTNRIINISAKARIFVI
jgi:hypothetical protein